MASHSTGFDTTENPLSESGAWTSGPGVYADVQGASSNARPASGSTNCGARLLSPSIGSNQYAQGTVAATTRTDFHGLYVRMQSTTDADGYRCQFQNGSSNVFIARRTDNGSSLSSSQLGATISQSRAEDDVERIEMDGDTIEFFHNGSSVTTRTDATHTGGQPGFDCYSSGTGHNAWKAWEGGDLTGGSYSMTADSGSYTLTGTAATLRAARTLSAASGSYTLTGTAAGLKVGRVLTAEGASFTLTGTAATLRATRTMSAASGSYSLTGTDAGLLKGQRLTAESGTYTLTGTDAALRVTRRLAADSGAYTLTGQDATLTYVSGYSVTAESGLFTLTGSAATLRVGRVLTADSGTLELSGSAAGLLLNGAAAVTARQSVRRGRGRRGRR